MSLCPHCKKTFTQVTLTEIEVVHASKNRKGVSYDCPHCRKSLSVAIDPIAVRTEIVAQVTEALRSPSGRSSSYS